MITSWDSETNGPSFISFRYTSKADDGAPYDTHYQATYSSSQAWTIFSSQDPGFRLQYLGLELTPTIAAALLESYSKGAKRVRELISEAMRKLP